MRQPYMAFGSVAKTAHSNSGPMSDDPWPRALSAVIVHVSATADDDGSSANPHWGLIFLVYFAYVLGMIVLAFFLDKCQVFDNVIHKLTLRSQENYLPLLEEFEKKNPDEEIVNFRGKRSESTPDTVKGDECCDCCCSCGKNKVSDEMHAYKIKYVNQLVTRPLYLATEPLSSTKEFVINLYCWKIYFAPGCVSDFFMYLLNNHSLFSMAMSTRGHPYSRAEKRSAFFCLNCVALSFAVFVNAMKLSSNGSIAFNVFVVSPIMMLLSTWLYYLLACPCTMSMREGTSCWACMASCLNGLGWVVLFPLASACLVFLIMASLFNSGNVPSAGYRIAAYAYSVHVVSAFQEALLILSKYWTGRYCVKFYFLCCIPVFSIGTYFQAKSRFCLVAGIDYEPIPKERLFLGLIAYDGVREIVRAQSTSAAPGDGKDNKQSAKEFQLV